MKFGKYFKNVSFRLNGNREQEMLKRIKFIIFHLYLFEFSLLVPDNHNRFLPQADCFFSLFLFLHFHLGKFQGPGKADSKVAGKCLNEYHKPTLAIGITGNHAKDQDIITPKSKVKKC